MLNQWKSFYRTSPIPRLRPGSISIFWQAQLFSFPLISGKNERFSELMPGKTEKMIKNAH
jgi:hypothetical protein